MKKNLIIYSIVIFYVLQFYSTNGYAEENKALKPNFIFIMMDDFGVGQFAPASSGLSLTTFDEVFVQYVADRGLYTPKEALQASREAMPTLLQIAEQGIHFTRAFATAALCAPSRVGIATGIHQNRFGMYENSDVTSGIGVPEKKVLAARFQEAGYATGHIGKWHLGPLDSLQYAKTLKKHRIPQGTGIGVLKNRYPEVYRELDRGGYLGSVKANCHPLRNGFDYYYGYNYHQSKFYEETNVWENFKHAGKQQGYNTEVFTDKAVDFMKASLQKGKPFFMNVNYHAVHGPLRPEAPDRYFNEFDEYPDVLRNFFAHVYAVDQGVEKIIATLEELDALENTCIFFTADNGAPASRGNTLPANAPYRGHKGQYVQGGFRVPLLCYWPARNSERRQSDALVSLFDLVPTAMDAAGLKLPPGLDGKSLLPLIDGKTSDHHEYLVWLGLESISWGYQRELRAPQGPGVRAKEPGSWTVINGDWLLRFTGTVIPGIYSDAEEGLPPKLELYNIREDPGEMVNLVESESAVVKRLKNICAKQAAKLPPPVAWRRDRWEELMDNLGVLH